MSLLSDLPSEPTRCEEEPEADRLARSRTQGTLRVLRNTLLLNWLVAAAKIAIGLLSGRATILADGFHSLLDGANNVVALIAIRLASRPPDAEHPYGHRKFENLAAMIIGGLVVFLAWETLEEIGKQVSAALSGHSTDFTPEPRDGLFIGLLIGTMLINLLVARYEYRAGVRLGSHLLVADSSHTRADCLVTALGLVSLLLSRFAWWIDPLLAAVVVGFLLRAAWQICEDTVSALTERQRLDPVCVRNVVESVPGALHAHAIRSHGAAHDVHLDLQLVVSEGATAREAAEIETRVRAALSAEYPNVTHIAIAHHTDPPDPRAPIWAG